MSSKASVITNLIVLAAGIVLLLLHSRPGILHWIIFVSGMMFIIPGLINVVLLAGHHKDGSSPSSSQRIVGWISSIAAVTLGIVMVIAPDMFVDILVFLFGGLMILASLSLIYILAAVLKTRGLPGWLYIGPVIVLVAGVGMVCVGPRPLNDNVVTLITGIGMIIFALSGFSILIAAGRKSPAEEPKNIDNK